MNGETLAVVVLKKGDGRTIKAGGAWVYDNEIDAVSGAFENGDIVRVEDFDGYPMGYGFINIQSKIRVRMISRDKDANVDDAFFERKARAAWEYRKAVTDISSCRVIFGEADGLPGLVVDKYEDVLVVESLCLGMDKKKMTVLGPLVRIMAEDGIRIRGIYERSDAPVRGKEGMQPFKGWIYGGGDTRVKICENGVRYIVDFENGQKTGFFLDQKYNRSAVQQLVGRLAGSGKGTDGIKVLDCFTHMGTFALNAGLAGARDVLGLDISAFAVAQARENAELNGLSDRVRFEEANVLLKLPELLAHDERFDVVVVDPPAFTKSREATKNAVKGYRQVNTDALRLVRDGGYFATCSCSHFMTPELFSKTVLEAAAAAHVKLKQVEFRYQAPDHPVIWTRTENTSQYLKFIIFQVLHEK